MSLLFLLFFALSIIAGCSHTISQENKSIFTDPKILSNQEVQSSLKSVAESLSGQELDEKDLVDLSRKIKNDKEAQTAVQSVTEALSGQNVNAKYCPIDGKRYNYTFEKCPDHDVILKKVTDE